MLMMMMLIMTMKMTMTMIMMMMMMRLIVAMVTVLIFNTSTEQIDLLSQCVQTIYNLDTNYHAYNGPVAD